MNHFAALIGKLKSVTKPVTMTTIPRKPKSCGDNNRANAIIVAVCTTNLTPCADTAATPPTTDFRFRSATDGCARA
jgi:hypothetical protein